jgi:hypothetical protein
MKEFICKRTIDLKSLEKWVEDEIGIRKAKIYTKKGFKSFVVSFEELGAYKTKKQNKAFHSLLNLFFVSGCFSYPAKNVDDLKNYYKRKVGLVRFYTYSNGERLVKVNRKKDIPEIINKDLCLVVLDSWSNATKKQAKEGIELLIAEMLQSGVEQTSYGKKFHKILGELEK